MLLNDLNLLKDSDLVRELQPTETVSGFCPPAPENLRDVGVSRSQVESLVLKYLMHAGTSGGRAIANQVKLPFSVTDELLREMKKEQLVGHRTSTTMHDYIYELTPAGFEKAQRASQLTTYFGAAPVGMKDYLGSIEAQSLRNQQVGPEELKQALADLSLSPKVFSQVGQAVKAAKAMFLYGLPGNGKTSIAQRICSAFGEHVWIPRALNIDGEIVRLYDPLVHEEVPGPDDPHIDHRWIRVVRPTIIAGGELTMENLEMTVVGTTGIIEAPLQLKANCGILVIDDFGRQRVSATDLLNRWIVPLETAYDFLNMPSGKKIRVPFEQMIVFSTNLEPRDLVDEAFLRRIPYKVEAPNPTEKQFFRLFQVMAEKLEVEFDPRGFQYLVQRHFKESDRTFRYCHGRDLLMQIKNLCEFHGQPARMTKQTIDAACENYFVEL